MSKKYQMGLYFDNPTDMVSSLGNAESVVLQLRFYDQESRNYNSHDYVITFNI